MDSKECQWIDVGASGNYLLVALGFFSETEHGHHLGMIVREEIWKVRQSMNCPVGE